MLRIPWLVGKKLLPWCNFILMRQKLGLGLCMYWMLVVCQSDGVVPSMHLCHSLALAVTLPLMMTNDKVDFRHNQASHHRSISFIYVALRTLGWWTKLLMMSLTDHGNRDLSADDDK